MQTTEITSTKQKVSLLIPVYNEAESLPALFEAVDRLIADNLRYDWEVMLVNDGSSDRSLQLLRMKVLADDGRHYHYLDLSRNFGKEHAMHAGFDHVSGDCTIIMDADLQHPLEVIPQMLEKWHQGYDDVYGRRTDRGKESALRRGLSLTYYKMLEKLADDRACVLPNVGDFRLLDASCIAALRSMRENQRYTKGMYSYIGFRKTAVDFAQKERATGESKQNYGRLFALAIEGITSHSTKPLRIATVAGLIVSLAALVYIVYIIVKTLLVGEPVQGFPTLMVTILFLGGLQLLAIGIIGEYLGRIFNETKRRPDYFIREKDLNRYRD